MTLRKSLAALVVAASTAACAATAEYRCPPPIGFIVRDDCDVYRVRYESAQVKLKMGVGPTSIEADFKRKSLRDPSELVQVMGHRMTALCHDFNACRLTADEYRRRRDEADRTMTALLALGSELKNPDLTPAAREKLIERITILIGEPRARPAHGRGRPPDPTEDPRPQPSRRKIAFFGIEPWFDTRFLPPVAPPAGDGLPRLVTPWRDGRTLDIAWVPRSPSEPNTMKIGGYRPRASVTLWGRLEADDQLELTFHDGDKVRCPVGRNHDGVTTVFCKPPKTTALHGTHLSYRVAYRRAADAQWTVIGTVQVNVAKSDSVWATDLDSRTAEGWVLFLPEPAALPPDYERPYFLVVLRVREKRGRPTARCWVGDEPVTDGIRPGRMSAGLSGDMVDRPENDRLSLAERHLYWRSYLFPLPFLVPRDKETLPANVISWPAKPGEWRCQVKLDGVPVREVRFTVNADGKLDPLYGQRGRPGDFVIPWWRVRTTIIPNGVEAVREDGVKSPTGGPHP